jgi:hypothetical protein
VRLTETTDSDCEWGYLPLKHAWQNLLKDANEQNKEKNRSMLLGSKAPELTSSEATNNVDEKSAI